VCTDVRDTASAICFTRSVLAIGYRVCVHAYVREQFVVCHALTQSMSLLLVIVTCTYAMMYICVRRQKQMYTNEQRSLQKR
jgi:hypothetical protein